MNIPRLLGNSPAAAPAQPFLCPRARGLPAVTLTPTAILKPRRAAPRLQSPPAGAQARARARAGRISLHLPRARHRCPGRGHTVKKQAPGPLFAVCSLLSRTSGAPHPSCCSLHRQSHSAWVEQAGEPGGPGAPRPFEFDSGTPRLSCATHTTDASPPKRFVSLPQRLISCVGGAAVRRSGGNGAVGKLARRLSLSGARLLGSKDVPVAEYVIPASCPIGGLNDRAKRAHQDATQCMMQAPQAAASRCCCT